MGRIFQESDFIDSPAPSPDQTQITIGLSGKPRVFSESDFMPEQQAAAPSYLNEALGVKNRLLEGGSDLFGFADSVTKYADPTRAAGAITRALMGQPEPENAAIQSRQILSDIGALGTEKAATPLGKVAEGLAYYAPNVLLPGGATKPAIQSMLASGLGSGIARANDASEATQSIVGALSGTLPDLGRVASRGVSALLGGEDAGMALRRKSFGATAPDYRRTAEDLKSFDVPDDLNEVESLTKSILNRFASTDELGKSRSPQVLAGTAIKNEAALDKTLWDNIRSAEAARTAPVVPTFDRAMRYIESGKVDATTIDDRLAEIEKLKTALTEKGKGSIPFLHNQRVAWGGKWDSGNKSLNGFYKAVYNDLNDALREAVPNYQGINQEIQAYKIVRPILEKGLSREEASNAVGKIVQKLKTTGGQLTTPTVIGAAIGGTAGGPLGLAAGAALGSLAEPKGMDRLGRAIIAGTKKAPAPESLLGSISNLARPSGPLSDVSGSSSQSRTDNKSSRDSSPIVNKASVVPRDNKGRFVEHTTENLKATQAKVRSALLESSNELKSASKKDVSMVEKDSKVAAIEAKIDADPVDSTIYEMESSRNPKAKNKTSSAAGGFQLISATAKKLGVSDVYDLGQNYEGYLKLKAEAAPYVEQPSDYYAFHYLGQPTYLRWKKGKLLTNKQQEQVDYLEEVLIPKFERIYAKKTKAKTGQVEA